MRYTRGELTKCIKARDLPGTVLIFGQEAFFFEEIIKLLKENYSRGGWGYEVVDASELDIRCIASATVSLSFDSATKLTLVRSAHRLTESQLHALEKLILTNSKDRILILTAQVDKAKKSVDNLVAWAQEHKIAVCQLNPPRPKELEKWLEDEISKRDFTVSKETFDYMIDISAANLLALSQMLDKLDIFRGEKKNIKLADVEDLLHDSFEKSIYDCMKAVFSRNRDLASSEMRRVLSFNKNDGILQIVRILTNEAFRLLKYNELIAGKASREEIAKALRLGSRKWLLQKEYPDRARKWPSKKLHRLLKALAEVDLAVKITGRDAEAMLEQVVIGNLAPTSVEEFDEIFA
ncbi:DNA polymerase III subunit delta [candidate division WOR-3 bacterium]|nr:DNA polymerase III subunit delta [candidate division WOR-3 bacterium]